LSNPRYWSPSHSTARRVLPERCTLQAIPPGEYRCVPRPPCRCDTDQPPPEASPDSHAGVSSSYTSRSKGDSQSLRRSSTWVWPTMRTKCFYPVRLSRPEYLLTKA
jgi:hypothetical protein